MNALQGMDRYRKEVIQVSTLKNDKKVRYLYHNSFTTHFKYDVLSYKIVNFLGELHHMGIILKRFNATDRGGGGGWVRETL